MRGGQAPGPGAYTISGTEHVANKNLTPGPGAYNSSNILGSEGAKYSVTARRTDLKMSETPGPGAYQPQDHGTTMSENSPNWSFGTSSRQPLAASRFTPGPGAYETPHRMGSNAP